MKKLLLAFAVAVCIPATEITAQNSMYVDSVVIRPANPSASDPVYLHVYGWSGYGTSLYTAPTVVTNNLYHTVDFCYVVGLITVVTSIHDSVLVFTGPAGQHVVQWNITQNSQSNNCDLQVESSQQLVNVSTVMGIGDSPPQLPAITWNSEQEWLFNTIPGKLSVYSADGRLVLEKQIQTYEMNSFAGETSGIYTAVFTSQSGERYTIRFFND